MQQQYTHTPETFSIFYNDTTLKLKEYNDKIVSHSEKLEFHKELLSKYDNVISKLENQNMMLQEKNTTLEKRIYHLDKYVYDLNKMMMKYFAYGKTPKTLGEHNNPSLLPKSFSTTPTSFSTTTPTSFQTIVQQQTTPSADSQKNGFTFGNIK